MKVFPEAFGSPGRDQTVFLAGTRALTSVGDRNVRGPECPQKIKLF